MLDITKIELLDDIWNLILKCDRYALRYFNVKLERDLDLLQYRVWQLSRYPDRKSLL